MVVSFICWVIRYSHHRHTEIVCWWLLLANDWQLWVGDQPPPLHINYVSVDWSTRTKRNTPTAARATRMSTMTISTVTHFSIDPPWCGWQLPGWRSTISSPASPGAGGAIAAQRGRSNWSVVSRWWPSRLANHRRIIGKSCRCWWLVLAIIGYPLCLGKPFAWWSQGSPLWITAQCTAKDHRTTGSIFKRHWQTMICRSSRNKQLAYTCWWPIYMCDSFLVCSAHLLLLGLTGGSYPRSPNCNRNLPCNYFRWWQSTATNA